MLSYVANVSSYFTALTVNKVYPRKTHLKPLGALDITDAARGAIFLHQCKKNTILTLSAQMFTSRSLVVGPLLPKQFAERNPWMQDSRHLSKQRFVRSHYCESDLNQQDGSNRGHAPRAKGTHHCYAKVTLFFERGLKTQRQRKGRDMSSGELIRSKTKGHFHNICKKKTRLSFSAGTAMY